MGAPVSEVKAGESQSAESLLDTFKSIDAAERRRHASVLNYWLAIKGDKDVAPIRDLDPLEISDAGPDSLLLELIGGGEDAEIKHCGDALKDHVGVDRLTAAARPSVPASIAGKLAIVAISRNFLAFEDRVPTAQGERTCWITLLPFSSTGVWVDYVYAFVSIESGEAVAEAPVEDAQPEAVEAASVPVDEVPAEPVAKAVDEVPAEAVEEVIESEPEEAAHEPESEPEPEPVLEAEAESEPGEERRPGFSKIFEALTGFHGTSVKVEPILPPIEVEAEGHCEPEAVAEPQPVVEPEAVPESLQSQADDEPLELVAEHSADEPAEAPAAPVTQSAEGPLQNKLEDVRAKADEARQAKLRSNLALYEGLSAAYDFALDAENSPEEYLRLVEAQGLKIQLRSPMTPVVKLAFDGLCDESTIGQLEAVLAWALKQDLPRGTLAGKIEAAGGIGPILNGQAEAA